MRQASRDWSSRGALAVAAVPVAVLTTVTLARLHSFTRSYDEGVYWASVRALSHGHALVGEVFSSQGPLFLPSAWGLFATFGHSLAATRALGLVAATVCLASLWWIARQLAGTIAGLVAVGVTACQFLVVDATRTLDAELPAVGLSTLGLALAVRARDDERRGIRWAVLAGVAGGAGVLTKAFVVAYLVPAVLFLWFDGRRDEQRVPRVVVYVVSLVATVVVGFAVVWHGGAAFDQIVGFHLQAGNVDRRMLPNVRTIFSSRDLLPLALLAMTGAVVFVRRSARSLLPLGGWILASFLVLVRTDPLIDRHRLLLIPPLAILSACAVGEAGARRALMLCGSGVVVLIGLVIVLSDYEPPRQPSTSEVAIINKIRATTRPGDLVVSDDQYLVASADRDVPPQLVDTSHVRLRSGNLTERDLERATTPAVREVVVTGLGRFELDAPRYRQWVARRFHLVAKFGDGTRIYRR